MLFPRSNKALYRYGRHKVVAILVTFVVVWSWLNWFAPDLRDTLRGFGIRTPGAAFRERLSGEVVQARAVVEDVLADSVSADGVTFRRARLRSVAGHPFLLLHSEPTDPVAAPGDTVRVRGIYEWGLRGGTVSTSESGWVRTPR